MQITPANLDAIFYGFNLQYQAAYAAAETWFEKVASQIPSTGRENRYAWLDKLPLMREWVGERQYLNAMARGYALLNKDFELTLELDRNDILDDQIGVFSLAVPSMGEAVKKWPDDLVGAALIAGAATTCFDGQAFFSASHPKNLDDAGAGTFSNYSSAGKALTAANYAEIRAAMRSYVARDGKPLGVNPNLLVVPPQLESAALQILHADFIAPAAAVGQGAANTVQTNVLKGTAEVLVVPQLAGADTAWYLLDTRRPIKPFVFQLRQAPSLVSYTSPTDPEMFRRKKFIYGADSRGAAGYTLPFLAYKAVA